MVNVVDAAERLGSAIDGCVLPDGDSKCAIVSKALPRITLIQVGDVVNLSIEQRAFSDVICDDIEDTEAAATRLLMEHSRALDLAQRGIKRSMRQKNWFPESKKR